MKLTSLMLALFLLTSCAEKSVQSGGFDSEIKESPKSSFFMTKPQPTEPVELVFDKKYAGKQAVNYRKNDTLRISGSATLDPKALKQVAKVVKKDKAALYVFDLRQESHGLINDIPVTWQADRDWANADLNHDEAVRRERRLLGDLRVGEKIAGTEIKSIETEESMVRSAGHQYVRLTVTDHVRPVDSEVDRFIEAFRALPENSWVHFHCRAGKGRTTTFMVLYDMLINAKYVSFDEIIERNTKLSNDYDVISVGDPKDWKYPYQKERADFVRQFYQYAKENPRGEKQLWSEWVK
ncbi:protein tyrosine phosphatase [Bdellovibrio bacteriovorus]|uniref:Protein tyrosine phosphatase n=1 Tax=Bdellovibrio bacteriovorus TaxID=959 RepID=A0A150WUJ1_BDEBC|nr:tyrosine-protein phosphatase [Bdellovibrio bacteriovorus]KYG70149.1 protein tyrosine phosphatase [Bdellovibrio bacteriovorus]